MPLKRLHSAGLVATSVAITLLLSFPIVSHHSARRIDLFHATPGVKELVFAPLNGTFTGPFCDVAKGEYDDRQWVVRDGGMLQNMSQFADVYWQQRAWHAACPVYVANASRKNEKTPAHIGRILKTSSYVWRTRSGCSLHPFDVDGFVVRLLKGYSGLVLIGDSLTKEHYDYLMTLLLSDRLGGPFLRTKGSYAATGTPKGKTNAG
ncbi:hypothetical protein MNV49_003397 [Pseudohyphozyma bogoriensis]|nr:hypothetical protein MNV49_003397 [Pseudohyphozyma bogoriensis]